MESEIDERIIDCFVAGDEAPLKALSEDAGGEAVVRARAKALGLTKEFIKKCRLSGSKPAQRVCMRCDSVFLSWGVQNRLCRRCSSKQ